MKKLIAIAAIVCSFLSAEAQSNILSQLESYLVNNDMSYTGWQSNHFTLWEAAAFESVNGTAGESTIGNDLGLEIPLRLGKTQLHLDSVTRFEQVFGDIGSQSFGLAYDYNYGQIQLSAGLDARYTFTGSSVQAVPYIEFKKASESLSGTSPFIRYSYPLQKSPGAGEVDIGLSISF